MMLTAILTTPIQPCTRWSIISSVGSRHDLPQLEWFKTLYKCKKRLLIIYKSLRVKFLWLTILVYRCSICFPYHIEGILITILVPSGTPLLYITNLLVLTSRRHSTNLYKKSQVIPGANLAWRKHPLKIKWKLVPHQVMFKQTRCERHQYCFLNTRAPLQIPFVQH